MGFILSLISLALGALALGYGVTRGKGDGTPAVPRPYLLAAVAVVVLGALATLPTGSPWSPGQTLAPGLVLGGAAVLLAAVLPVTAGGLGVGVAAATVSVALLLVFLSRNVLDALNGLALGAVASGILLHASPTDDADEGSSARLRAVENAVLSAVILAAATFLATFHPVAGVREWQALPVLFAGTLAAALPGTELVSRRSGGFAGAAALILPLAVMAGVIGWKLNGTPHFFSVMLVGLALFALTGWLGGSRAGSVLGETARVDVGLLAALLVLGGAAAGFRWFHGYGIGLLLLAGLGAAALFRATEADRTLRGALALGALVLLFRLFAERAGYKKGLEPDFIYYYVALILGALLAPLIGSLALSRSERTAGPAPQLLRLGLAGVLAALAPLAVWLLFGEKAQAALLVGLAAGAAWLLADGARTSGSLARMTGLAVALSAIQFTHLLGDIGTRTRHDRVLILAVVGAVLAVWLGAVIVLERRRSGVEVLGR